MLLSLVPFLQTANCLKVILHLFRLSTARASINNLIDRITVSYPLGHLNSDRVPGFGLLNGRILNLHRVNVQFKVRGMALNPDFITYF